MIVLPCKDNELIIEALDLKIADVYSCIELSNNKQSIEKYRRKVSNLITIKNTIKRHFYLIATN